MTDAVTELAKRAVACKGWRWSSGMLWLVKRAAPLEDYAGRAVLGYTRPHEALPVLTDAATVGCLLALVRSAYSDPWFYVRPSDMYRPDGALGWECFGYLPGRDGGSWRGSGYASEAEALVAALEAAP
jgi:hypothetical protein